MGDQLPHLGNGLSVSLSCSQDGVALVPEERGKWRYSSPSSSPPGWSCAFSRGGTPGSLWSPDLHSPLPCGSDAAGASGAPASWITYSVGSHRRPDLSRTDTRERGRYRMARGGPWAMEGAGAGCVAGRSARSPALGPLRRAPGGGDAIFERLIIEVFGFDLAEVFSHLFSSRSSPGSRRSALGGADGAVP